jgi:hypothetical protein
MVVGYILYPKVLGRPPLPPPRPLCETVTPRELDYRTEAANAARFKELYSQLEGVYVPAVYPELTTAKVWQAWHVLEMFEGVFSYPVRCELATTTIGSSALCDLPLAPGGRCACLKRTRSLCHSSLRQPGLLVGNQATMGPSHRQLNRLV